MPARRDGQTLTATVLTSVGDALEALAAAGGAWLLPRLERENPRMGVGGWLERRGCEPLGGGQRGAPSRPPPPLHLPTYPLVTP